MRREGKIQKANFEMGDRTLLSSKAAFRVRYISLKSYGQNISR